MRAYWDWESSALLASTPRDNPWAGWWPRSAVCRWRPPAGPCRQQGGRCPNCLSHRTGPSPHDGVGEHPASTTWPPNQASLRGPAQLVLSPLPLRTPRTRTCYETKLEGNSLWWHCAKGRRMHTSVLVQSSTHGHPTQAHTGLGPRAPSAPPRNANGPQQRAKLAGSDMVIAKQEVGVPSRIVSTSPGIRASLRWPHASARSRFQCGNRFGLMTDVRPRRRLAVSRCVCLRKGIDTARDLIHN